MGVRVIERDNVIPVVAFRLAEEHAAAGNFLAVLHACGAEITYIREIFLGRL